MKTYRYVDLVTALFVAVLIISNIASSAKIVDAGFSIAGIRLAFDGGTLVFPLSYIFGDILTEVYGYARSRRVIWIGFLCLLITTVTLWVIKLLPGEAAWADYAGDDAYNAILGGMSSGAIVLASLSAYLLGEFANSFTLAKMKVATAGKFLWTRTIGSTLIGQLVDTAGFLVVASALGVFPWDIFWGLFIANYVFKVGIEAILTPVTYAIVGYLKRAEEVDHFDIGTDFNPLQVHMEAAEASV